MNFSETLSCLAFRMGVDPRVNAVAKLICGMCLSASRDCSYVFLRVGGKRS